MIERRHRHKPRSRKRHAGIAHLLNREILKTQFGALHDGEFVNPRKIRETSGPSLILCTKLQLVVFCRSRLHLSFREIHVARQNQRGGPANLNLIGVFLIGSCKTAVSTEKSSAEEHLPQGTTGGGEGSVARHLRRTVTRAGLRQRNLLVACGVVVVVNRAVCTNPTDHKGIHRTSRQLTLRIARERSVAESLPETAQHQLFHLTRRNSSRSTTARC